MFNSFVITQLLDSWWITPHGTIKYQCALMCLLIFEQSFMTVETTRMESSDPRQQESQVFYLDVLFCLLFEWQLPQHEKMQASLTGFNLVKHFYLFSFA